MNVLNIVLTAVISAAPTVNTHPANEALPERWFTGDWGTPVEWQGENLYLYADPQTTLPDGRSQIARSLITHNGDELIQPLDQIGVSDDFYWIVDGVELPDGKLLVSAVEVCTPNGDQYNGEWEECRNREYTNDGWGFIVVDTDFFIVNNPLEMGSWNAAYMFGNIEEGWWQNADQIEFSDQHPGIAFAHNSYCAAFYDCRTTIWEYDLEDPSQGRQIGRLPFESSGQVAPIQTDKGWMAVSFDFLGNTSTMWYADDLMGEWTKGETTSYTHGQTHAHGLNIIDGEVVHRYSTLHDRPTFQVVEDPR